ncbi:hypothetical protein M0813_01204 [Anaeramoeba flamelloides]|uniref:Uncharacterized protein n=1 Tax=Anaeramoeba flamelloides TaxID=1746091 RepID=A0ABQ8ZE96_9EUKA|nr:hypothetical protein M0813_01204 [Anaeramoeba flamelloides]
MNFPFNIVRKSSKVFVQIIGIDLSEAIGYTKYPITTGGDSEWFGQKVTYYSDVGSTSSAQSGECDDNQESWMQTTVNGTGTVSFYWKVRSEFRADYLSFYLDGKIRSQISGSGWHFGSESFNILFDGEHTLKWVYAKDDGGSSYEDCGWVDKLTFNETQIETDIDLAEAVDNPDLNFTTGGDAEWFGQNLHYYEGSSAARSGECNYNQESWMQTTVNGTGTVSFYWKVRSEFRADYLSFYLDGKIRSQISGWDWRFGSESFNILFDGEHTLKWVYAKDDGGNSYEDCGWVDKLTFNETQIETDIDLAEAVDNPDLNFTTGGDAEWFGQNLHYYEGSSAARSGACNNSSQESWMQTTVNGTGTVSFYCKVNSAKGDYLSFYIDGKMREKLMVIDIGDNWIQESFNILFDGEHTLKWVYVKDRNESSGEDCGWVDKLTFNETQIETDIDLAEAVDNPDLNFTTGGDAEWFGQNLHYYEGSSAARSGACNNSSQESWMQTTVKGKGIVSFYWKKYSRSGWYSDDYLSFSVDDEQVISINSFFDWRKVIYRILYDGEHTLKWVYDKKEIGSIDEDCGWVDKITFDADIDLAEAVDNPDLNFKTGGDSEWYGQNYDHFSGSHAARCDHDYSIFDNSESWMQTTVNGKGTVSFYRKISIQGKYLVYLDFYVDGKPRNDIKSGNLLEWEKESYKITSDGEHTLKWVCNFQHEFGYPTLNLEELEFAISDKDECCYVDKLELGGDLSFANVISPFKFSFIFFLLLLF